MFMDDRTGGRMAKAYYNEIDPYAAQWLRNLIDAGHIASGDVDTRSIVDVKASDLTGYTQCHFFAGIGVWSHALRQSGWSDSRSVWTGSCPCQPFSIAGNGAGTTDERHLWPVWFELIKQCRPDVVFGEQVESAIKHGWLDLVQADVEGEGYSLGAAGIPAAGVGAPHIRHRLYFVADADSRFRVESDDTIRARGIAVNSSRQFSELADTQLDSDRSQEQAANHEPPQTDRSSDWTGRCGGSSGELADTVESGWSGISGGGETQEQRITQCGTSGFWRPADWIDCKDGKTRPVEPSTFPLAYGAPARVGRLRAYGNAIVPQVAQAFIEAYLETEIINKGAN
jgi:DNA (cytosine-5)-methyltransferase 1